MTTQIVLGRASPFRRYSSFASTISSKLDFHSAVTDSDKMSNARSNPRSGGAASSGASTFATARSYPRSGPAASSRSDARSSIYASARSNFSSGANSRSAAERPPASETEEERYNRVLREELRRTYVCAVENKCLIQYLRTDLQLFLFRCLLRRYCSSVASRCSKISENVRRRV